MASLIRVIPLVLGLLAPGCKKCAPASSPDAATRAERCDTLLETHKDPSTVSDHATLDQLAQCYLLDWKLDSAQQAFERLASSGGPAWQVASGLATVARRRGDWAASARFLASALADPPSEQVASLATRLGYAYHRLQDYKKAREAFERALAQPVEQQEGILYAIAAYTEFKAGDLNGALKLAELGTVRFPNHAYVTSSHGWYLQKLGFRKEAKEAFNKAEELFMATVSGEPPTFWFPLQGRVKIKQGNRGDVSHASMRNRFAWDIVVVDQLGRDSRALGNGNERFVGFGQPVRAADEGRVVDLRDGVPDNLGDQADLQRSAGNFVYLEHRPGLLTRYFHLKRGSIRVHMGQRVQAKQIIGLLGNSGTSAQPHLCFSATRDVHPRDVSTPSTFRSYAVVEGTRLRTANRGVPTSGQLIQVLSGPPVPTR